MDTNLATVITGGGRGIGEAIARRMAKETAVVLVGRTSASLERVSNEINAEGGKAHFLVGDVSDFTTAERCVELVDKLGLRVQNLVLNAGIAKGGAATAIERQVWKEMFAVNVDGTFFFIQAFLPKMVPNKSGTICIISSIAGVKGYKYQTAYCATKHALVGMARALALEFAKHGICVVPICPAFVESDMTQRTIDGIKRHRGLADPEARAIVEAVNPQKRIIPADEVANMVEIVCSGKVTSLNGNPLILSGGE